MSLRHRFHDDDDAFLFRDRFFDSDSEDDIFARAPRRHSTAADSFISLQVSDCFFTQETVACRFRHGEFAGSFLSDVIGDLRAGDIDPNDMGLTVFEHGGNYYSFNNRTLYVLKQARVNVVTAKLWNRPNKYHSRICFGRRAAMR
ncbi:EIF4E2 [Symbiodinium natans]|uniref:EIF4E2 protein n=1 Tax=Symbiodinium natans TaxID=878477 RepID=A0A812G401_9DINO|nr:EIF4E2 [Symbiodinium natans]